MVTEHEDEYRPDQIENDVKNGVFRSVRDEYRFESETFPRGVNGVLDDLLEEFETDNGGDDPGAGIAAPSPTDGEDGTAQDRRGVRVREVIPPPDLIVRTEHTDGVGDHRTTHIYALPRTKFDTIYSFGEVWKARSDRRDAGVRDRTRVTSSDADDEYCE